MRARQRLGAAIAVGATGAERVLRSLRNGEVRRGGPGRDVLTCAGSAALGALAEQHVLRGNLPPTAFLTELDRRLRLHPRGAVVVLTGSRASPLAADIARAYPEARVALVDTRRPVSALHAFLAAHGPFDIVADEARRVHGRRLFRDTFFHLAPGGALIMRPQRRVAGVEGVQQFVRRILHEQATHGASFAVARPDEARLAESIEDIILARSHVMVTSKVRVLAKMREDEVNTVLEQREWASGRILSKLPGLTWASRSDVRTSASTVEPRMPKSYRAPDMFLREYYDVVCLPGQVAVQGNLILPDSYRHNQQKRLNNRFLDDWSPRFATPIADMSPATALTGAYFYLDSEWSGHFGHAMTEQMSRLWAWQEAKRVEPRLKALLSLRRSRTTIQAHELAIFASIGLDAADVVLFESAVRVERLVAATPMFSMPDYVHPDIREVWTAIGRRLAAAAPEREYARRIFCARKTTRRECRNAAEVESAMAGRGFQVVYPEDFPLPEQAAMFRHADVVAGYAGSAMFNLLFCETPKRVILISSDIYKARNEYMISSVLGHELTVLWCKHDAAQAATIRRNVSIKTAFTFDFAREGLLLEKTLESL